MLRKQNRTIHSIKALHNNSKLFELSFDEFLGSKTIVNLAVGSRVMLVQNLWIDKGLWDGAMVEVTSIVFALNNTPPSLPVAVMVKFDNYPAAEFSSTDSIPIVSVVINSFDGEIVDVNRFH